MAFNDIRRPIQLLNLSNERFSINVNEILEVFDKIGDKKVAIVSINGNKRTGKSFLLNYFLRYLNHHKVCGNEWINGENETTLNGFDWRGGDERHTEGIWMWSQPFMVKDKCGNDIALLLMDTQGNFDEQTTFQECCVIFSISVLLSSTLILNMQSNISEDKLQFVEFFTYFAESFSGDSLSDRKLFQRLVFLVRDWQNKSSYQFGYHDDSAPKIKNYKINVINPNQNQSIEAQSTRTEILSYFDIVSSFLMPHPGLKAFDEEFKGESDFLNPDFITNVAQFVPIILSSNNVEAKKIGGQIVTGNTLKAYLNKLSSIIQSHRFPDVKTITAATAEVGYSLAVKHSIKKYETTIRNFIETNPSDEELCDYHKIVEKESLQYFQTVPKGRISDESKSEMREELQNRIALIFQVYRGNNATRIDRVLAEQKLNEAIAEQEIMKNNFAEQKSEIEKTLNDVKNELSNVKEEAKVNELKQQMHLMEENAKLNKTLIEQKLKHLQNMTDMHKTDTEEKKERERINNENTQKTMSNLIKPELKLLGSSAAKDNLTLIKYALSLYETKMSSFVEKRRDAMALENYHQQVVAENLEDILNDMRFSSAVKDEIVKSLRDNFSQMFLVFREINCARIAQELSEENIKHNISERNKLTDMLEEHRNEIDKKLEFFKTELESVKHSKKNEMQKQMRFMEENAILQQSSWQKSLDDLKQIIDINLNKAQEKEQTVRKCKEFLQKFKEDLKSFVSTDASTDSLVLSLSNIFNTTLGLLPIALWLLKLNK